MITVDYYSVLDWALILINTRSVQKRSARDRETRHVLTARLIASNNK